MNLNSLICNRKQTDINYLWKQLNNFQLTRYCIRNCLASAKNCLLPFTVEQTETNFFKLLRSIPCQTECLKLSMPVWWANQNITYIYEEKTRYSLFRNTCFTHLLLPKTQKGHCCNRLFLKKLKHAPCLLPGWEKWDVIIHAFYSEYQNKNWKIITTYASSLTVCKEELTIKWTLK